MNSFLRLGCAVLAGLSAVEAAPTAAVKLLVKGGTFMTIKPGQEEPFTGYMTIGADGRIIAVAPGEPPADLVADQTVDATGKFVIPGFVSAHSHVGQSAFRGLAVNELLRGWGRVRNSQSNFATVEDQYWFTLHGCLDHIRHGITAVYNFTGSVPTGVSQNEQLRGELDSGIRFVHAWSRVRTVSEAEQRKEFSEVDVAPPDLHPEAPQFCPFS